MRIYFFYIVQEKYLKDLIERKEVLITKHASSPEYDLSAVSGKFCVQFITFNRGRVKNTNEWEIIVWIGASTIMKR